MRVVWQLGKRNERDLATAVLGVCAVCAALPSTHVWHMLTVTQCMETTISSDCVCHALPACLPERLLGAALSHAHIAHMAISIALAPAACAYPCGRACMRAYGTSHTITRLLAYLHMCACHSSGTHPPTHRTLLFPLALGPRQA